MGLITESSLRKMLKEKEPNDLKQFQVLKGVIVTPSAKAYLNDQNIELKYVDNISSTKEDAKEEKKYLPKYKMLSGGYLEEKPEHMTQLYGNTLVPKGHKRIFFRGKLDSLESKILEAQVLCVKNNCEKLAKDLEDILTFVRNLVRCEVLEEQVKEIQLLGMNEKEIREISHNPKKYFDIDYFMPNYKQGEIVIALNSLRSTVREVEISAYNAFSKESGEVEREDIMRALNRMSSLFWILMFKYLKRAYK